MDFLIYQAWQHVAGAKVAAYYTTPELCKCSSGIFNFDSTKNPGTT